MSTPKVAIVHERLTEFGGSERVVEELHALFPDAPIFTPLCDRSTLRPALASADIRVSFLQRAYRPGQSYVHLLPMLPVAMRRFDLRGYDAVITSHHAFANRVRTDGATRLVSYTHTPARWMWEPGMRRLEHGGRAARAGLHAFAATQRPLDRAAAGRLHAIAANSRHVADRIRRWWQRGAVVIAPPVDTAFFTPPPDGEAARRDDFFLLAGRIVPYKRPELAVQAAVKAGVRLVVAGEGRARAACEAVAGPGVEILGRVSDDTLLDLYRRARAVVMPGEEDFGIIPVEAQACGTPVLAAAVGGALDSVVDGTTGTLYRVGTDPVEDLAKAMRTFDAEEFSRLAIRRHAEGFAADRFRARIDELVRGVLAQ